jgi:hypothetical protein
LAFFYLDLVEHINNVKLSIELSYIKLKKRFLKKRKRVTVLNYSLPPGFLANKTEETIKKVLT